jgi:hypothetical protein
MYEFVKKGDPAVVGITKLDGVTLEELKRPRRQIPLGSLPIDSPAELGGTTAELGGTTAELGGTTVSPNA